MLFVLGLFIGVLLGLAAGLVLNRRRVLKEGGWITRHDLAIRPESATSAPPPPPESD